MPATSRSGEVGLVALGHRAAAARPRSRAAPSRGRARQHLTEVVVAVDALQRRPVVGLGAADSTASIRSSRPRARDGTARDAPASSAGAHAVEQGAPGGRVGRHGRQRVGEHAGAPRRSRRRGRGPVAVKSLPARAAASATRQASSRVGEELLRDREVAARAAVGAPASGHSPSDRAVRRRHAAGAGRGDRGLQHDVGVLAVVQRAEDLHDHGRPAPPSAVAVGR